MKMTVCEFPNEATRHEAAWTALVHFLQTRPTDVVVLPEMPFCDWRIFMTRTIDPAVWEAAVAVHDAMIARFGELQAALVLASRPSTSRASASIKPLAGRGRGDIRAPIASTISRRNPMDGKPPGLRRVTATLPPSPWGR
jgi:hypothetical protein